MAIPRWGKTRKRIDLFDWGVLFTLAVLSVWVMIVLYARQGPNNIWTGTDGTYISDQMNYLGWIQFASTHLLISNPFTTAATTADFLHPGLLISTLLVRFGMPVELAYLLWKPVAVIVLFAGTRRYVRASIAGLWPRRFALVLSLVYISPAAALVAWFQGPHWTNFFFLHTVDVEMWPVGYLWGYSFTAIAIGAMALALLAYERDRKAARIGAIAPLLGLLCAWLQPWQGTTLIAIVLTSELILRFRGDRGRLGLPAIMALAITAPLLYYSILSHFDSSWKLAGSANLAIFPPLPWQPILVSIIPLAAVAALAYRLPIIGFHDLALRVWPIAALIIYWIIGFWHVGTFPLHSLQGVGIPLAVLAITGAQSVHLGLRRRTRLQICAVLVALLVIPSGIRELQGVWSLGSPSILGPQPFFITSGEQDALRYLKADHTPGAVLTPFYLGQTIPAETGRRTWLGSYSWTPSLFQRIPVANALFSGRLSPSESMHVVTDSGAHFLLSDCHEHADLSKTLQPQLKAVHHFGCATVYELRAGA
jgi:hypothetical protein